MWEFPFLLCHDYISALSFMPHHNVTFSYVSSDNLFVLCGIMRNSGKVSRRYQRFKTSVREPLKHSVISQSDRAEASWTLQDCAIKRKCARGRDCGRAKAL